MTKNTTNISTTVISDGISALSASVRFGLLLGSEIPSLTCSIFVLYNFIFDPVLRRSLPHHTIIILNIFGLLFKCFDVPFYLNFLLVEGVWSSTTTYCLIWLLADYGFYNACVTLTAWISIERHIFVYHNQWLSTPRKRFFVHYLPMILINSYLIGYYTWIIFFPPCENVFDYDLPACGATPCFILHPIGGVWDAAFHGCLMIMTIVVFSIGLIVRVLMGKCRHHQALQWRQHRKMTLQLLSSSSIYIICGLPSASIIFFQLCGVSVEAAFLVLPYFFFGSYWVVFLTPFVCLNSLPNWKQRITKMFCISPRRQVTVGIAMLTAPQNTTRT